MFRRPIDQIPRLRSERSTPSARLPNTALRPVVLAVHLAAAGMLSVAAWTPSAYAQTAAEQARHFNIPAGTLTSALNRFAEEVGVLLSAPAEITHGRSSAGLSGSFNVEQGFAELLKGQNLSAVRQANGSYALRPAPAAAPVPAPAAIGSGAEATLPPVTVTAPRAANGKTEGSGSYAGTTMRTATLLPLTARETPQSVTVITRARIEDQAMVKASDALKYTPGITPHTWSGPNREAYFSRGFAIENFTYDGLPAAYTTAGGHGLLNDLAIYDRVEIVRGATGLSQGTGSPSATINFVRKRPTQVFQASIEGTIGQWNHLGAVADLAGPLNEAGNVRGRMVVSGSKSDSFQDVVGEDRGLFYAIGEVDLGARTLLTAALTHQRNSDVSTWAGLPTAKDGSDLKLPRSTFLGNDWNYWDTENTSIYTSIEHRFANDWKLVGAVNHIDVDQARCVTGISMNTTGGFDLNGNCGEDRLKRTSIDVRAQGPFGLFGRKHDLVVGAAAREGTESGDIAGYGTLLVASDIDIYNWGHNAPMPDWRNLIDYHHASKTREHGIYASTRFSITDPLKLIVGARVDWFKQESSGSYFDSWATMQWVTPDPQGHEYNNHLTKYAGITYDLGERATLYASYTDIFQPQDAKDKLGAFIKPIIGKNYETGVKTSFADDQLQLDAAVFRIEQENIAQADPTCPPTPGCSRPSGLVRSQGFDLELLGRLTPSWDIGAGYTYANPKTIRNSDTPSLEGTLNDTHLPRRLLKATSTYRLPGGQWRVGGGLRWQSDVYHHDNQDGYDYRTEQKAYTVVDAMVGYEHDKKLSVQLNVTNLFDKHYWRVINTQPVVWGGNALYGEPRRLMLTTRYKF